MAATLSLAGAAGAAPPYLETRAPGWDVRPLLSAGEPAGNGYRMAGVPDGLGAYPNGDGTFTVLMNHELARNAGAVRAHGATGAFVSRWVIDVETLAIRSGADGTRLTVPAGQAFNRLCSADLAPPSALQDAESGSGFAGWLFMNGEEDKAGGYAYAHAPDGTSYRLDDLGRIAWENVLVHPGTGRHIVLVGLDDTQGGLVLVYRGEKRGTGNPAERAGLVGGQLYAVRVEQARFALVPLGDVATLDGMALRQRALASGATPFARPEDGAWDTRDRHVFWFATTDRMGGDSRLFRLLFDDPADPARGGRIETVLRARDIGAEMFDNITVDGAGRVLIEEDPGDHARLAALWMYDPADGRTLRVGEASPGRFIRGAADFLTQDEEHSGIIEVTELLRMATWFDPKRRYYLGTTQAHLAHADPAVVEHGQLWLLSGPAR